MPSVESYMLLLHQYEVSSHQYQLSLFILLIFLFEMRCLFTYVAAQESQLWRGGSSLSSLCRVGPGSLTGD